MLSEKKFFEKQFKKKQEKMEFQGEQSLEDFMPLSPTFDVT